MDAGRDGAPMQYYLYTLCFDAPVHFGAAERGGGLEHTQMTLTADALFSAMAAELSAAGGQDALQDLLAAVRDGRMRFSDLLPWREEPSGDWDFYVPRPAFWEQVNHSLPDSYASACALSRARKQQKKTAYVRASRLQDFGAAVCAGRPFEEVNDFGEEILRQRVNCRGEEPLPYFVGSFAFHEQAGLYLVLAIDDADTDESEHVEAMACLLDFIGQTGIGGKRSSGYGKFHLADDPIILSDDAVYGEDDGALYQMLSDTAAEWQMAIAPVLPGVQDIEAAAHGLYRLRHVGGFVTTDALAEKKNSICLLDSGSCLHERIAGSMAVLGQNEGHPVLRYGYGLYLGIREG